MNTENRPGQIITFYSYKGGTGRTMLMANVAWILASAGKSVLAVDWDLEAPGLQQYFHPFLIDPRLEETEGLIDMLTDYVNEAVTPLDGASAEWLNRAADVKRYVVSVNWQFPGSGRLHILPAGRQNASYSVRVNTFGWQHFYEQLNGGDFIELIKKMVKEDYEYVLIDSRTGVSDTSGICTVQMPDKLVICFTASEQNILGSAAVAWSVKLQWSKYDIAKGTMAGAQSSRSRRRILPVFTRIVQSEKDKLDAARAHVRKLFRPILEYAADEEDAYWNRVEINYWPYYAFEEVLAVFGDRFRTDSSLLASCESVTDLLTEGEVKQCPLPEASQRELVLNAFRRRANHLAVLCHDDLGAVVASKMPAGTVSELVSSPGNVFISYARADDVAPPMANAQIGWVTFFWNQLRWELINRGAKGANLWLNRYEIEPAEAFTPAVDGAIRGASLFIPVLSNNWASSEWCRRELDAFVRYHPDALDHIVPVIKDEPPREVLPELPHGLSTHEGYRFFSREPSGQVRQFYWRGLKDEKAYFDVVNRIAQVIMERLGEGLSERHLQPAPDGPTVYVAVTAQELRDARQRLVNDLTGAGFTVVPAEDDLPDTVEECSTLVRGALMQAELAVHLLGENPGKTPRGGSVPILRLQLDLAREISATGGVLPRVLWAPRWLPGWTGPKRDPFEVANRFGGILPGEELHGEEVTDLSQWLRRRLEPPAMAEAAPITTCLVASAHPDDDEDAADLANRLQGTLARVQPVFAGEVLPNVGEAVAVIVPWRLADRPALDALLARLPPDTQIVCLRLPGGDEAAKRRFFRNGVYVEKLEMLPPDRQAARNLLDRLEILGGHR